MYYYFLTRPRTDITSTMTVTDFVPNALGRQLRSDVFDVAMYVPRREQKIWELRQVLNFGSSHHIMATSETIGLDVGELAVGVPLEPGSKLSSRTDRLPAPRTRNVDGSPVAARCSLRFSWQGVSSSYQSEYPLTMAERVTGPLNSFNLASSLQGQNASVLFCAVNIMRDAQIGANNYSILPVGHDGAALRNMAITARRNSCSVIETDSIEAARRLAYSSSDAVFLPLYLVLGTSAIGPSISVEHTHPPHEMFWQRPARDFCLPKLRASWEQK
jgi:hypothetical protein